MLNLLICKGFCGEVVSYIGKYMYQVGYVLADDTYLLQNEHFEYDIIENISI